MTKRNDKLVVETPMGTLTAYPSKDPNNPGIFIDLSRPGDPRSLNLAGVECNIDEDTGKPRALMLRAWEVATQEDTTIDTSFSKIDAYFGKGRAGREKI